MRHLPVTSGDVSALVVSWLRECAISPHTKSRYRRDLGRLAGFLHTKGRGLLETRAEDITALAVVLAGRRTDLDQRSHPLRRSNTIATAATAWSSFFEHCVRHGRLASNPVAEARAATGRTAYPPHPHNEPHQLDERDLRALLVEAHRDDWLGGPLGASLVGLLIATGWRPERITGRWLADVSGQLDTASGRPAISCGDERAPLPEAVHGYLDAWIEHGRPTGHGPELFRDRSGYRPITAVDLMRLVNRCAQRAGLGESVTASQVARAAARLAERGIRPALPPLDELVRTAPAPEQLALPDTPDGYDSTPGRGQVSLFPLPDNVVRLPGRRGRNRRRRRAG